MNAFTAVDRLKIRPEHLQRTAFIYVRQSSLRQVPDQPREPASPVRVRGAG